MIPEELDFPSKIQIQTINLCNYACPMCPYPDQSEGRVRSMLDVDLFYKIVAQVRAAKRRVKLCLMLQNDPLLDRRFLEFLDYAHAAEDAISSISTVTNGSVLTDELLDRLVAYERFYLTISVNATDRERYRKIHGRDLWDRVHGLLTKWEGSREKVRLSFVLDSTALDEGRHFQSYWQEEGYQTRLVPLNSRVNLLQDETALHFIDEDYGHCHYPVDTLNILADGAVILCCNDWEHKQLFGNLNESSVSEVWNAHKMKSFRLAALEGRLRKFPMCKGCDYPMRSSERVKLETLVSGAPLVQIGASNQGRLAEHVASMRLSGEGATVPVFVRDIDAHKGIIYGFAATATGVAETDVSFEFRIGHSGAFSFGSLDPVWCPGKLSQSNDGIGVDGVTPIRVELDSDAPQYKFFQWYFADWSLLKGGTQTLEAAC
jgi:sulfatase maturation enzyme AslB (radical SAM superfamily)